MNEVVHKKPERKVLSLKLQPDKQAIHGKTPKKYLHGDISHFMVWCPDGEMPKRVYKPGEKNLAITHAKRLAAETGSRFYVMRTWRGYDPEDQADV